MEEKVLQYGIIQSNLIANGSVVIDPKCNSITIINVGATLVKVNYLIPLNPGVPGTNNGESISFGGNRNEIFNGRIDIGFAGGVGNAIIFQKIYL